MVVMMMCELDKTWHRGMIMTRLCHWQFNFNFAVET